MPYNFDIVKEGKSVFVGSSLWQDLHDEQEYVIPENHIGVILDHNYSSYIGHSMVLLEETRNLLVKSLSISSRGDRGSGLYVFKTEDLPKCKVLVTKWHQYADSETGRIEEEVSKVVLPVLCEEGKNDLRNKEDYSPTELETFPYRYGSLCMGVFRAYQRHFPKINIQNCYELEEKVETPSEDDLFYEVDGGKIWFFKHPSKFSAVSSFDGRYLWMKLEDKNVIVVDFKDKIVQIENKKNGNLNELYNWMNEHRFEVQ